MGWFARFMYRFGFISLERYNRDLSGLTSKCASQAREIDEIHRALEEQDLVEIVPIGRKWYGTEGGDA